MGQEIDSTNFTDTDRNEFHHRVRKETKILKSWFDQRRFTYEDVKMVGLEIEAWIVDQDHLPAPKNEEFLEKASSDLLVKELSQYNFEVNLPPTPLKESPFTQMKEQIQSLWTQCHDAGNELGTHCLLIGVLPTIREEMLNLQIISSGNRYKAMNEQIFHLRDGKAIVIDIKGKDSYQQVLSDVMLEAAATSIQVHLQVNQENAVRFFNASQIASAGLIACAANSPYLYGKSLWDESRIPIFEQAIHIPSFKNKRNEDVGRVTFGTGYLRHSFLELYLENLDGYPPLLPFLFNEDPEKLTHLNLHNGTVWRWNRPIVGVHPNNPHLRIEHRIMPSGPSIDDIMANTAFYVGLVHYFALQEKPPEESMTFTDCRNNFYAAAKDGLSAQVRWFGRDTNIQKLVLDDLVPKAKQGLLSQGIDPEEVSFYLDGIIHPRAMGGNNGAAWQRAFIARYGPDFQALSEKYLENQLSGRPVHEWKV